jgi:type IV secretion system protein VirD4
MNNLDQNYYSHWLSTDELLSNTNQIKTIGKDNLDRLDTTGIPVGSISDSLIIDKSIDTTLVIGSMGSGKTQVATLPLLYQSLISGESVIATDIKGELYNTTAGSFVDAGFNVINIDLTKPAISDSFNPFTLVKELYDAGNKDEATKLVESIVEYLIVKKVPGADPFWDNTASQYLTGVILSFLDNKVEANKINFKSLAKFANTYNSESIIDYLNSIDKDSLAYQNISATHLAPPETKASIMSVLNQKITLINSKESLSSRISTSTFDINKIRDSKTIVYFNLDNTDEVQSAIFNIFFEEVNYVLNNDLARKPINIIIDDFDENVKPIKNLSSKLPYLRGRYARVIFNIKGFDKLESVYGKDEIDSLKYSCAKILYLLSNEYNTLKFLSEFCGKKSEEYNLVSPEALRRMPMWSCLLIKSRLMPYYSSLIPFYKTGLEFKKGSTIIKKNNEVEVFDLENL